MAHRKHPGASANKPKLDAPSTLNDRQKVIFVAIVGNCAPEHFVPSDCPLVSQYAVAIDTAEQAQSHLDSEGAVVEGKANPWLVVQEKSVRAIVALSARLRLAPQSRIDRTAAGTNTRDQHFGRKKPWERDDIDDDLIPRGAMRLVD